MENRVGNLSGDILTMQQGGNAPLDMQIMFNIMAIMMGIQIYDNFLKEKYGGGKTIDELVGLK